MDFWGHSQNADGSGVPEPLSVHIQAVAQLAEHFASWFGMGQQALVAGLLHDLGKFADQFQRRVRGRGPGLDHATVGAYLAVWRYREFGAIPAMAIQGHHVGLGQFEPNWQRLRKALVNELTGSPHRHTSSDPRSLYQRYQDEGLTLPPACSGLMASSDAPAANLLDVRMLFSALVDADFLATEAHFNGDALTPRRPRPQGPDLDITRAMACLSTKVQTFDGSGSPLAAWRSSLFNRCLHAGDHQPGLFTLTAPTGFGKTLAMLAFALKHAQAHGMRRIILVMPFLNIIEQTARIYRSLFNEQAGLPPHTVLEHHSLIKDGDDDSDQHDVEPTTGTGDKRQSRQPLHRLLSENWDAPIILTTNVQLLESMMAHKPSPCRKLHRLARSVILFDEAQTLPAPLAKITLATLSRLADPQGPFRSTVLFATATQPAFDVLHEQVKKFSPTGWAPREINLDQQPMFQLAGSRIVVHWQHDTPKSIAQLAQDMAGAGEQLLAIVNLKRHAVSLATALRQQVDPDTVLHLSTSMCPAHRLAVIDKVRHRLEHHQPIRLVSTQCIEAGVDLDFPVVYRAFAPLEAICQAAGRCNRHGKRQQPGRFTVFQIDDPDGRPYPPGYCQAISDTRNWLNLLANDHELHTLDLLNDPQRIRSYYRLRYGASGRDRQELDDEGDLHEAVYSGDFPAIAQQYKLIRQDTISVLVPYDRQMYDTLQAAVVHGIEDPVARRQWPRKAAPYAVSLYRQPLDNPLWCHLGPVQFHPRIEPETVTSDWFIAQPGLAYDELTGLIMPGEGWHIV